MLGQFLICYFKLPSLCCFSYYYSCFFLCQWFLRSLLLSFLIFSFICLFFFLRSLFILLSFFPFSFSFSFHFFLPFRLYSSAVLSPSLLYSSAVLGGSLSAAFSQLVPSPLPHSSTLSASAFALLRLSSCVCVTLLVSLCPSAPVFLRIRLLRFLSVWVSCSLSLFLLLSGLSPALVSLLQGCLSGWVRNRLLFSFVCSAFVFFDRREGGSALSYSSRSV